MKALITLATVLITHLAVGQISFEKGYFIYSGGERVECEIRNRDWRNNPSEFEYKISDKVSTMTVDQILEFGIYNKSKYTVTTVQIDMSPVVLNALSRKRNAEFETKRLALKVIVEGKATLFMYENQNAVRFFYSIDGGDIHQLVYKMYHSSTGKVLKNNEYQQDLLTKLNCGEISQNDIARIPYKRNDLESYFILYNRCSGQDESIVRPQASAQGRLIIRPNIGGGLTTMKYKYSDYYDELVMKNGFTYRIGAEVSMVLPFNNNKWHLLGDIFYQSNENSGTFANPVRGEFKSKYSSITLAVGPRYHFFLPNKRNKIFVNGLLTVTKPTKFDLEYSSTFSIPDYDPSLLVRVSSSFGAGISLNRLNTEIRYSLPYKFNKNASPGEISFSQVGVIFSYRLN